MNETVMVVDDDSELCDSDQLPFTIRRHCQGRTH